MKENMESEQEWKHVRRMIGWGLAALLIAVGVGVTLSVIFRIPSPTRAGYFFPFFPFFGFGWVWGFLLVFALFWVVRWAFWSSSGWGYSRGYWRDEAYYLLRERYAKGEITKEQFEQMKGDLERNER